MIKGFVIIFYFKENKTSYVFIFLYLGSMKDISKTSDSSPIQSINSSLR